ncbi:hypothetical protein TEA_023880 [Camellia sinensis var. sinensis]|uniref:ABC1 atypical kinase-like domain-containing protein n=1 Tax=Camellia sinensis var. sinensis TaxID=542762 RepID=A0A4S4DXZ9_CAMSN|nr:hypothetical protein TEA_023880 [Camellia sinensis var. sinensis]
MIGPVSEQKVVDSILGAHWSSPRVRLLVVSVVAVCSNSGTGGGSGSSVSHHGAGFCSVRLVIHGRWWAQFSDLFWCGVRRTLPWGIEVWNLSLLELGDVWATVVDSTHKTVAYGEELAVSFLYACSVKHGSSMGCFRVAELGLQWLGATISVLRGKFHVSSGRFSLWVFSVNVFQLRVSFEKDVRKQEAMWERQHEFAADKLFHMCSDLGGFFLKVAQVIGKPDLAPAAWVRRLVTLCDQAPATPLDVIQAVLENELGQCVDELFERFDADPIGSASIAQVLIATVMQVQHPGVQDLMMTDIRNLKAFALYIQKTDIKFDLHSIAKEMEKQTASLDPPCADLSQAGSPTSYVLGQCRETASLDPPCAELSQAGSPAGYIPDQCREIGFEFDFKREADAMERIKRFMLENNKKAPVMVPRVMRDMVTRILSWYQSQGNPTSVSGFSDSGSVRRDLFRRNSGLLLQVVIDRTIGLRSTLFLSGSSLVRCLLFGMLVVLWFEVFLNSLVRSVLSDFATFSSLIPWRVLVMEYIDGIPILKLGDEIDKRGINPRGMIATAAKQ